jgi:hypothetical protein
MKKYGKRNFTKTIIDVCESEEAAYELEALIVDESFLIRDDTYNLCGGGVGVGSGEANPRYGKRHSDETITKMKHAQQFVDKHISLDHQMKMFNGRKAKGFRHPGHSDETKLKISINNKARTEEVKAKISLAQKGIVKRSVDFKNNLSNIVKGRIHINNGVIGKFILPSEEIPDGFIKGRLRK